MTTTVTQHRRDRRRRHRPRRRGRGHQGRAGGRASPSTPTDYDLGGARYLRTGEVLTDETVDELRGFDAILLGAVGTPEVPPGVLERGLLLKLRFDLDLYVNLRPFLLPPNVDFLVVRENTEGTYAGEGGFLRKGTPHEIATQGSVNTRMGVERCIRFSFDLARSRRRRHLTLVHKTNVLTFAGDLWQRTFDAVHAEYPDVDTAYNHVDAACIYFVQDPQRYDVIVTDNLFGDILTDLGGAVSGGIGVRRVGEPQSGPHRAVALRAGARLGSRHRRHGQGKPDRRDPVGGDDARVPGRGRRRRPRPQGMCRTRSDRVDNRDRRPRRRKGLRCPSPRPRRSG